MEVLPARRCSNAAGWLVGAISDGWQLHDEAKRRRAARTRSQQHHDDAQTSTTRQQQRDVRLAGWATATCDALTDAQLTDVVQRVTRPVGGLDRRSVRVAASQLLAWTITTATTTPDQPLAAALRAALRDHTSDTEDDAPTLPDEIPPPPATTEPATDPDALRRRIKQAIDDLQTRDATRQPKLEGGSDAP